MPIIIPAAPGSTSALQSVPTQQVFDYLYDSQGNALKAVQVVITLAVGNATSITPQVELSGTIIRVTTDNNGYWTANLIPNANINPANTTYSVQPPGLDAYSISVPSTGGPFQSTSPAVLVNTPGVLAPATTGITGSLAISGNETVAGTLNVAGTTTLAGTTTGGLTTGAANIGGDLTIASAFRLLFGAAAAKIVGGATSLSLRNNADNADNVLVADNGNVTIRGSLTVLVSNFHAEVYPSVGTSCGTGAFTQLAFDTVESDPNSNFATGASAHYTCPATGRYLVTAVNGLVAGPASESTISVFKNGAEAKRGADQGTNALGIALSAVVHASSGDTLDIRLFQASGGSLTSRTGPILSHAQFTYLGP